MREAAQTRAMAHTLAEHGYCVTANWLPREQVTALRELTLDHQRQGRMAPARTGKSKTLDESIRGDSIRWLDEDTLRQPEIDMLAALHELRQSLNEHLLMNLHEVEAHLAHYPPGAGYEKHLDQFAIDNPTRQLSMVLYLNRNWRDGDGGELRLYLDDGSHIDISPLGGRLVLFLSSRFWHEVLPAARDRLSVTGWFRTRSTLP